MATPLRLRAEDVRPVGRVPNHTAFSYAIFENGEQIGQVNFAGALGMMNRGEDVPSFIAETINGYAERMDEAELRSALDAVLGL
jgi:hypothetical protein